ncbi:protein transport protein SEC16A homolog isoform X2 [Chenopodium quinoa]|uniref:protein transport protein SEC16A homolog isoform X2 n=1 Tax=Chenopodium quinoa TaxID=63459 RepID=UPI000B78068B|nr:protein transport protein SEC16A homolog isoform X2 [Chenopodium quinoa]
MASNPPFELEDQTDEDFFDKLVNDDDDDDVSSKTTGLVHASDLLDGNESDELKEFANLSTGEISRGNSGAETVKVEGNCDNLGIQSLEARGEQVVDGEANSSLVSSDSPVLDNGPVTGDGDMSSEVQSGLMREISCSPKSGVKEVQWSAFTDSAMHGSGGVGFYDEFLADLGGGELGNFHTEAKAVPGNEARKNAVTESLFSQAEYQGSTGAFTEKPPNGGDTYSIEYWESLYPGWKYDSNTAQWYQLHGSDGVLNGQESFDITAGSIQGTFGANGDSLSETSNVQSSQNFNAQQTAQSAVGTISQLSITENLSGHNSILQHYEEHLYPAHMIFDSQYPGWYYDTIAQQWFSLEVYHATDQTRNPQVQNGFLSSAGYSHASSTSSQGINNDGLQGPRGEGLENFVATSIIDHDQQGAQFGSVNGPTTNFSVVPSWQRFNDNNSYGNNQLCQEIPSGSTGALETYKQTTQSNDNSNWAGGLNNFSAENNFQLFNHAQQALQNEQPSQYPTGHYSSQHAAAVPQPLFSNAHHVSCSPSEGRSSAGRPPHALVTFGFGGKLVVMKDNNTGGFSALGSKDSDGCFLSVLNLMEVVSLSKGPSCSETSAYSYFHSLYHQSFPGPLIGGNVGSKDMNKWIDDKISNCESLEMNYGKRQGSKLLLSLLKIACQHYGKLRSFGGDTGLKENDLPESAVAKLFASSKRSDGQLNDYNAISKCLMTLPSEAQIQTTATEVQNLLISGRKMEALQQAQDGHLWGFALILARELGDQLYADTVKKMAVSQLVVGSPLRTLCLLIARKPEEVFCNSTMPSNDVYEAVNMLPQSGQNAGFSMLENWEENLAVITANRTENDHLVIIHLGDCLLKEKHDVIAAHICYLVAEAGFELYSDSARLCLIGADHWNFPRTYASPEAIQMTELYEYAKVLGNSQFVLLQLQPYKLIYAHMLAEVGRISDSLKYCQAVYKSLKIGRSPEADTLKQLLSSLEERIRTHQQSGYSGNLAPAKIVGKLLNFIDNTAHRVVGGLPPPGPSSLTTQSSYQGSENQFQTLGPKVTGSQSIMGVSSLTPLASMNVTSSQSTMGLSSLTPSASMEPISQWAVDESKMTLQSRSVSEPDIGKTKPDQVDSSNEATSSSTVVKQSGSAGTSRFGRLNFGAQILQKTVGLVLKPLQGHQAKLGDTNKFYYDEKLKRWVEEGAEPTPEESALPPPPTAAFQNGRSDYNLKNALNDGMHAINGDPGSSSSTHESSPAIPSMPSSNQFSARGRMGVRSRYVDTFNKGGGASTNLFQAPSVPSAKPTNLTGTKFFIPLAAPTNEQTSGTESGSGNEISGSGENSSSDPFQNLAPSPIGTMQRFSSVDALPSKGAMDSGISSLATQSRRTASWSAVQNDTYTPPSTSEIKSSPLSFMPGDQLLGNLHMDRDNSGNDLQEVEL